jgi:hypothetical protein
MKLKLLIVTILFALIYNTKNFLTEPDSTYFGGWVNYKISNITENTNEFEYNPSFSSKPNNHIPTNDTYYIEIKTSSINFYYGVYDGKKVQIPLQNIVYKDNKIISANDAKCFELLFRDTTINDVKKLRLCLNGGRERDACLSTILDLRQALLPVARFKSVSTVDSKEKEGQVVTNTVITTTTTFNPNGILPTIENTPIQTNFKDCESKECYVNVLKNRDNILNDGNFIPAKIVMNLESIVISVSTGGVIYMVKLADIKEVKRNFNYPSCFVITELNNNEFIICEMNNIMNCSSDDWIRQITRFKNECSHRNVDHSITGVSNVNHPPQSNQVENKNDNNRQVANVNQITSSQNQHNSETDRALTNTQSNQNQGILI